MVLITLNDGVEMLDGFTEAALFAADAAKLVVRVGFVLIDLDGAAETAAGFFELTALLIDRPEVVRRRGVSRVERGDFEVALEVFAGALLADQVAEEISEQQNEKDQQKRRTQQSQQRNRNNDQHDKRACA